MKKKLKAKFIGKDSCGFKHNEIYEIDTVFDPYNGKIMLWVKYNGKLKCPYESLNSFIKNWEIIK